MIGTSIPERIGIHKVALCFLEKFGWIEREQYVADQGIDTQIEIVENGKPTGLLYCVQVKARKTCGNKKNDSISYYLEERHVDYWLNHSLPVIFVLCELKTDVKYWNFVTRQNIIKTNKGWKIEIPIENQLDDKGSVDKIRNFYFSNANFTIVESGIDNSHALSRRISMKIVLKRQTPNIVIEEQLPNLIEGLKRSDYYRSEIVEKRFRDQPADCVWIWFYRNFEQYRNGLPFCTAFWNHPNSKMPTTFSSYDSISNDIFIKYSSPEMPDEIINRRLSKGKYLKLIDQFMASTHQIYSEILTAYKKYQKTESIVPLKRFILSYKSQLTSLLPDEYQQNNAPLECVDLDQIIQNMSAAIGNIMIVVEDVKRNDTNILSCIGMYLNLYAENIGPARYERNKVV